MRNWLSEFGREYAVPAEVQQLVGRGILEDQSWHNDASPLFVHWDAARLDGFAVWIEHPDQARRELTCPERFAVVRLAPDGAGWSMADEVTLAADDV